MRNERGYRGGGGKGKGVGRGRGGKRGSGRGQGIGQGKVGSRRMGRCQGVTPMAGLALDASLSRDAAQVTVQLPISLERHRSEQKPREQGTDEDRSGVYFDVNKHRTAVGNAVIEAECRCPYVSERLPPQQALVLKAQTQDTRSQLSTITHRIAEIEATGPDSSVSLERPSTMISNREKRFLKMTAIIDREVTVQGGI